MAKARVRPVSVDWLARLTARRWVHITPGSTGAACPGRRYDEMITYISGIFELTADDSMHRLLPGEMLGIPKGTVLECGGMDAFVIMAIAPVN